MKSVNNETITESISDFTAIATILNTIEDEKPFTNAKTPSWFGSVQCATGQENRVNSDISCATYQSISVDDVSCNNTQARDHYVYVNGEVAAVSSCYPIHDFLMNHQSTQGVNPSSPDGLNYLSLTNMMNPAVFKETGNEKRMNMSKIYFRIKIKIKRIAETGPFMQYVA